MKICFSLLLDIYPTHIIPSVRSHELLIHMTKMIALQEQVENLLVSMSVLKVMVVEKALGV